MKKLFIFFMIMICIIAIHGQQIDSNQVEKLNAQKIQEKIAKTQLFNSPKIKYYNIKLSQLTNFLDTFDK